MRSVVLVLFASACGVESRPPPNNFVGEVAGTRALVSMLRDPGLTSIYVCDGTTSPATFEWFSAETADTVTATSASGGATITIDFPSSSGQIGSNSFSLIPVDSGFGLYRGVEQTTDRIYEVGIILVNDDTQNGVVGITETGSPEITPLVTPRIARGQTRVTLLDGTSIELDNVANAYSR